MSNNKDRFIIFDRKKFLKYIRDLGCGGTGTTILCKDEAIDMLFAIKKYAPTEDNDIAENYNRFVDEIKILHNLNHPNIVRVYMSYLYPDYKTGFIQMEYIDGQAIDKFTPNDEVGWNSLFLEAIDAFNYMHQKQILHRDIRPENILVDMDNKVKVIDFGFGKKLAAHESAGDSVFLNWPVTAHPHEVAVEHRYTYQSEVYFLGKLFARLTTGEPSSQFKYHQIVEKMSQINPMARYHNFQEVMNDISEGALASQNFTREEKDIYQNLASALTSIIDSFSTELKLERDTGNILNGLEILLRTSSLEDYIQDNAALTRCFLKNNYRYMSRQHPSVSDIEKFYELFRNLSEQKRQTILDNLAVRLSKIKVTDDPFADMPF